MKMQFCPECGSRLVKREHPTDGPVPFCDRCQDYRYPVFSTAIAVMILSPDRKRMLLVKQYGEQESGHVAGYIDKGETAEHAVRREVMEEMGMKAHDLCFYGSHYYGPSETLMLIYSAVVYEEEVHPNPEIDSWEWIPAEKAKEYVRRGDLADIMLDDYYEAEEKQEWKATGQFMKNS